jgi:hypothetical protein
VVGNVRANQFIPLTDSAAAPGLCVAVETDTGFFRPAGDTIAIATGGSEIARFTSAGRLGLGTSSPIALLDVRGNVYLAGNGTSRQTIAAVTTGGSFETGVEASTGGAVFTGSSAYAGVIGTQNATSLQFGSNGAIRATLDSSGRLGIGTTSPGTSLDVNGKLRLSSTEDNQLEWVSGAQTWRSNVVSGGKWYLYDVTNTKFPLDVSANTTCKLDINTSHVAFTTSSSERARIDSSGRLLVGTSSADTTHFASVGKVFIEAITDAGSSLIQTCWNASDTSQAFHILAKSGGASVGTRGIVAADESLGQIAFEGDDGTNFIRAASIRALVDGTPGTNDMPGRLMFSTTADGASSPTERMRLDSSGRLGIGTTSPGNPLAISQTVSTTFGNAGTYLGLGGTENTAGQTVLIGLGYKGAATNEYPAVIGYTATSNAGNQNGAIVFGTRSVTTNTAPTERARIDSDGRLLVGTSSARTNFHNNGSYTTKVQIEGTDFQTSALSLVCNSTTDFDSTSITLAKSGGSTIGSNTLVANGEELGSIRFEGNDGTEFVEAAKIIAEVDGTPGANDMPGRIILSTTSDGASSPTERWRIDSAGSLIGVAGSAFVAPYIFNSTTASAANCFVQTGGFLLRSTSSIKYKTNVETIQDQYADAILGCRPVWYQSTCEADKPDWGYWGFIAEEVAAIDPRLCFFKEEDDGTLEPEGVQYDRFVPHLLNLIQRQKEQIEAMEARLSALEAS